MTNVVPLNGADPGRQDAIALLKKRGDSKASGKAASNYMHVAKTNSVRLKGK